MNDDFEKWWDENGIEWEWTILKHDAKALWVAVKQVERERIKAILEDAGTYCSWDKIMEAIDQ